MSKGRSGKTLPNATLLEQLQAEETRRQTGGYRRQEALRPARTSAWQNSSTTRPEAFQRALSPGAGCALLGTMGCAIAICFWSWVFLVLLLFNPNTPQTLWPALIAIVLGGGGIITSFLWVPPLYASLKRSYLQRFGEEALAEITDIHRKTGGRSGVLSWVQLDWRWQMSDGQICQDNTVYAIQDRRRTLPRYQQFIDAYPRGGQFPVYFLPRHPHVFIVPAVKQRAHTFISDFFMGGGR